MVSRRAKLTRSGVVTPIGSTFGHSCRAASWLAQSWLGFFSIWEDGDRPGETASRQGRRLRRPGILFRNLHSMGFGGLMWIGSTAKTLRHATARS